MLASGYGVAVCFTLHRAEFVVTINKQSVSVLNLQLDPMVRSFAQMVDTRSKSKKRRKRRSR